jgi:tartrate dehydratase alpha subunit/fumarate hydratase class I-like protein
VPRFSIHVRQGKFSSTGAEAVFENSEAARKGALAICADLGREIFAELDPGSEWQMDVTNESGNPIFQIRLYSLVME